MDQEENEGGRLIAERPGSSPATPYSKGAPSHPGDSSEEPNDGAGKPRRKRWWIVALVLTGLAIVAIRYFTGGAEKKATEAGGPNRQQTASITVGQAKAGDINIYVDALGNVTPTYTVTVYSQITGRVMAVHYREGQMVQAGDPLIDIDPSPYRAILTQAQGTLQHDQGVLAQARIDLARYQAAYARNAIAKQQLDDQEQAVVQDEGTVKADQGAVAYDEVQLGYCHIVAPIGGRVGLRLVDPGNTVFSGSGSTLVVITQLQPITVVFNVSEDDLPQVEAQLRNGHSLAVDAYDRSNNTKIETGTLDSLDNEVDTATGTVKFRASFPNRNRVLFPNQFVNARLLVRTLHKATLVPSVAVQHNGTADFVYVVQPGDTVAMHPVTTLTGNDEVTAVQGVNPGVALATSGFDRLENGAKVSVSNQTPGQNKTQGGGGAPSSAAAHSAP